MFSKSVVNRKLANKDGALQEDLAAQMAEKCDGMFLLIRLQENQLSRSKNKKQLQAIVNDMPSEQEHAYERDWEYISTLPNCDRLRALDILRWVTFALRPLTVFEITEALLIEDNADCDDLQSDDLPDNVDKDFVDEQIIGLCGSLFEIRSSSAENTQSPGSSTIHLAHFSVKQYLLAMIPDKSVFSSDRNSQNGYLAKLCLRYLNYPDVWISSSTLENDQCHGDGKSDQDLIDLINMFFKPGNPTWDHWRKRFESIMELSLSNIEQLGEDSSLSDISLSDIEQPGVATSFSDKSQAGETPGTSLHYAALFGLDDTIQSLQSQKDFDPNVLGGIFGTALQAACKQGNLSTAKFLIDSGADINMQGGEYVRAIFAAIASEDGHFEMVKILLDKGADMAVVNQDGDTPLINAVYYGHIEVARLLLDRGANLFVTNNNGSTPLIIAAVYNHFELVEFLLDKGADQTVVDQDGDSSLMCAILRGHLEVVRLLLDRGASLTTYNNAGFSPLSFAANHGHPNIVKLLLERGADLTITCQHGNPPTHYAAQNGHLEVVRLLLDKGADQTIIDHDGNTPLMDAIIDGHLEVIRLLLDRCAPLASTNNTAFSPLCLAASHGHLEVTKLLLERGVDAALSPEHRKKALDYATAKGHLEVTELLNIHFKSKSEQD